MSQQYLTDPGQLHMMKLLAILTASFIVGITTVYLDTVEQRPANRADGNTNPQPAASSVQEATLHPMQDQDIASFGSKQVTDNQQDPDQADLDRSLSRYIKQYNIPISATTTYNALLEQIDNLPLELIRLQLTYLFDRQYVSTIENAREFSRSLVEIALSQQQQENATGTASIDFSFSPVIGLRELAADIDIDQFDTVYAHIATTQDMTNTIIKWQHLESGEILLFTPLPLDTQKQSQYVVIRPGNGWHEGHYQVTIHNMDGDRELVAANRFHVTSITQNATGSDKDILQDLILTGRAFPKRND